MSNEKKETRLAESVRNVISVLCAILLTVLQLLGELHPVAFCFLIVDYILLTMQLIFYIYDYYQANKAIRLLEEEYNTLKLMHQKRYELYFTGDIKQTDVLSEMLKKQGNVIIDFIDRISTCKITQKQNKRILSLKEKVTTLMTTVMPTEIQNFSTDC